MTTEDATAERDDLRAQLAAAQAQLAEARSWRNRLASRLEAVRALHYAFEHPRGDGRKICIEDEQHWPCDTDLALDAALPAAPQPEPERRRDWMRPTAEMTELENVGGATLKRACIDLGLPTWGTKKKIADRLLDVEMTADLVRARWSWRALHDNPEPPASDEPARCGHGQRGGAHAWQRSADGVLGWACMSLNPGPAASGTSDGRTARVLSDDEVDQIREAWKDPDYVRRLAADMGMAGRVEVDNPFRREQRPRRGAESGTADGGS